MIIETNLTHQALSILFQSIEDGCFPSLQTLLLGSNSLSSCSVELAQAIRMDGFHDLQILSLSHCGLNSQTFLHFIYAIRDQPLQQLTTLHLAGNSLHSDSINYLATILNRDFLPSLEYLNLSDNPLGDEGVHQLLASIDCHAIHTLCLNHCHLTDDCVMTVVHNIRTLMIPSLKLLQIRGSIVVLCLDVDNKLSSISVLYLQSLFELPNALETIEFTDITRRRSSFIEKDDIQPAQIITEEGSISLSE